MKCDIACRVIVYEGTVNVHILTIMRKSVDWSCFVFVVFIGLNRILMDYYIYIFFTFQILHSKYDIHMCIQQSFANLNPVNLLSVEIAHNVIPVINMIA